MPDISVEPGQELTATLYHQGEPVVVAKEAVEKFKALGFLEYSLEDLAGLNDEIELLCSELSKATREFVTQCATDGQIDPRENGELHRLNKAFNVLREKVIAVHAIAATNYPVAQAHGGTDPADQSAHAEAFRNQPVAEQED